jgi:hypothetical protein
VTKGIQPRLSAKASKFILSLKGSLFLMTARRLAQKQPSFKESVTAHWLKERAPKIYRGLKIMPKLEISPQGGVVEERSDDSEVKP